MAIEVAGKRFVTLADEFFVNGAKVYEAWANGMKVYPDESVFPYDKTDEIKFIGGSGWNKYTGVKVLHPGMMAVFVRQVQANDMLAVDALIAGTSNFTYMYYGTSRQPSDWSGATSRQTSGEFTYKGKTVYYGSFSTTIYKPITADAPYNEVDFSILERHKENAWEMVYGERVIP